MIWHQGNYEIIGSYMPSCVCTNQHVHTCTDTYNTTIQIFQKMDLQEQVTTFNSYTLKVLISVLLRWQVLCFFFLIEVETIQANSVILNINQTLKKKSLPLVSTKAFRVCPRGNPSIYWSSWPVDPQSPNTHIKPALHVLHKGPSWSNVAF